MSIFFRIKIRFDDFMRHPVLLLLMLKDDSAVEKMSAKNCKSSVVILAAGFGKRMKSTLPKVLIPVGGQPLVFHILDKLSQATANQMVSVAIVVGHSKEAVIKLINEHHQKKWPMLLIEFIEQIKPNGTGHALKCVADSAWGKAMIKAKRPVLVLPGDLPLISENLIAQMIEPLPSSTSTMRLLTCTIQDPTGYGRIVRRGKKGSVIRVVEEKDANLREKEIHEVAASIYLFSSRFMYAGLQRMSNKNAQAEYYLTDLVAIAGKDPKNLDVLEWPNEKELRGVNDPWELTLAQKFLNESIVTHWAKQGVRFMDPCRTYIDSEVKIEDEVIIGPGAILQGATHIKKGAEIGANVVLKNVIVGEASHVKIGTVAESVKIGTRAQVGPYAHLRPGTDIGPESKIGNFVELKASIVGKNTNIAHLSYLGDAVVGDRVNIGCGFVTCNFDGRMIEGKRKHTTVIEDDVFMGSDCQTIAPVKISKGAYIASGSTITTNVDADSLAIARSRQVNKPGYAKKLRGI